MAAEAATAAHNRDEQARLYGAPLGTIVDELVQVFAVSRSRLATVLGLSAPMLSQLATGHRQKIGNPLAVERLQMLMAHVPEVRSGGLGAESALRRVEAARQDGVITRSTTFTGAESGEMLTRLLRQHATREQYLAAAEVLADRVPQVAEVLRVHGGRDNAQEGALDG